MLEFIRYCFINCITFISNITIHALLFRYFLIEQYKMDLGLISLYANLLTIPISFALNYYYVFKKTSQSVVLLINKFVLSSVTFLFIFHSLHFFLNKYFIPSNVLHISITIICSLINFYILSRLVFSNSDYKKNNPENLKIILHADDFGLCDDITNDIFDCIMLKRIHRTSVVCNTSGFSLAHKLYKEHRDKFDISLHLNLVEGKPITDREEVSLLVNKKGYFKYTFLSLWCSYLFSKPAHKTLLKQQVKKEIVNQMTKFKTMLDSSHESHIHLDSHTHIHMIPFVLDTIIEVAEENKIDSLRLTNERFYFCISSLRNYFSLNIVKHILLNFLSELQVDKIKKSGLSCNSYFIGVLSTGNMKLKSIRKALKRLKNINESSVIEILFHPGGLNKGNSTAVRDFKFQKYYASEKRKMEKKVLIGDDFFKGFTNCRILSKE